jgi:hypothetical protein
MKTLHTPQEIKKAVDEGKTVFCDTAYYTVIKDNINQYFIKGQNGHLIGLTGMEGTKYENDLNGCNFFTN